MPRTEIMVTISPAIITPAAIARKDFRFFIPKTQAPQAPVYAPVMGKGMATKITRPQ